MPVAHIVTACVGITLGAIAFFVHYMTTRPIAYENRPSACPSSSRSSRPSSSRSSRPPSSAPSNRQHNDVEPHSRPIPTRRDSSTYEGSNRESAPTREVPERSSGHSSISQDSVSENAASLSVDTPSNEGIRFRRSVENPCHICKDELISQERRRYCVELTCGHIFHQECYSRFRRESKNCIICNEILNVRRITTL